MRSRFLATVALTVLAGCGSNHGSRPSPAVGIALAQVRSVATAAAHAPQPGPGFKVPGSGVRRLHGLDLWNAIVDPMIYPLAQLTGRSELRTRLSVPQYAVYVLFSIDTNYADGGMFEVYYNDSGVYAREAVRLLTEVGAPLHAAALARTNRVAWPHGQIPASEAERRRTLGPPGRPWIRIPDADWQNAELREGPLDVIIERFIRSHASAFLG